MARRAASASDKGTETERRWPHPRTVAQVIGHGDTLSALETECGSGGLHHGLLLVGPRGIGKATLAYAMARRLLSGKAGAAADDPQSPTFRQLAAGAHPDLLALDGDDSETVTRAISVDTVRRLVAFFARTASGGLGGEGGYRVGIVDRADDMTTGAANALLKLLEEPPQKAVLILICEVAGRLPATIRSRCRQIRLAPLQPHDLASAVAAAGGTMPDNLSGDVQAWIGGSVLRALDVADAGLAEPLATTDTLLGGLPGIDQAALGKLAAKVAARDGREAFDAVFGLVEVMLDRAATGAARQTGHPEQQARAVAIAQAWPKLAALKRDADVFNLDRGCTLISAFGELALAFDRAR